MIQVLLLEHDDVRYLYPFSITHCAWELRVGRFTNLDRWTNAMVDATVTVASNRDQHVRSFVERNPGAAAPFRPLPTLMIGGHIVLSPDTMRTLESACMRADAAILLFVDEVPVGAFLPDAPDSPAHAQAMLDALDAATCTSVDISGFAVTRLWQTFEFITQGAVWDSDVPTEGDDAVVHMSVAIDEEDGPVLIEGGAVIEPHVYLKGPVVIGRNSLIKSGSRISNSLIGPSCKVSGDLDTVILQGNTSKQHEGFLGNSYLGEWINLGAGTTTSNLKNTYGNVSVDLPWGSEDTGLMFLGLLMGDHTKTAIGTRFSTGSICGVGCNIVSDTLAPRAIGSFSWIVAGETVALTEIEKMLAVARIAMSRRSQTLQPHDEALLRTIHDAAAAPRTIHDAAAAGEQAGSTS